MKKVVINDCYGGFGLSGEAKILYAALSGTVPDMKKIKENRTDPYLVKVVEQLGKHADTEYSRLKVVEFKDKYFISSNDGLETLYTPENINWKS